MNEQIETLESPKSQALAEEILEKNMQNIAKKAERGETLTNREMFLVQNLRDGSSKDSDERPKSAVAMAQILGISRSTFTTWRKNHQDFPKSNSDGSWDSSAVIEFCKSKGLVKNDKSDADEMENVQIDILKEKLLKQRNQRLKDEGKWVEWELVCAAISDVYGTQKNILDSMPRSLAYRVNPSNPGHAEVILKEWIDKSFYGVMQKKIADFQNKQHVKG